MDKFKCVECGENEVDGEDHACDDCLMEMENEEMEDEEMEDDK